MDCTSVSCARITATVTIRQSQPGRGPRARHTSAAHTAGKTQKYANEANFAFDNDNNLCQFGHGSGNVNDWACARLPHMLLYRYSARPPRAVTNTNHGIAHANTSSAHSDIARQWRPAGCAR